MKSLPRSTSAACASVRLKPNSRRATTRAAQFSRVFSAKRSASWVVSGNPNRMAPDLPRNRNRMPCLWKQSRISCACRYSNAAIAQPIGQVLLAPAPVVLGRVKGAERSVVQHRLLRVDEGVTEASFQWPPRRALPFPETLGGHKSLREGRVRDLCGTRIFGNHGGVLHHPPDTF